MAKGRPTKYTEELAGEICAAIATCSDGLDSICKDHGLSSRTVYRWLLENESFCQRYTRAREMQQQVLADQIVPLADQDRICKKVTTKSDGTVETVVLDQVDRSRLQIEARKWLLGKLNPKKYGDKTTIAGDKDEPVAIRVIADI